MTTARIILTSVALAVFASAAIADDAKGLITKVDRLNGTIAIQQVQNGTVGGAAAPVEEFKTKDAGMLDSVHAGDRVSYSSSGGNGTKTLTKLQKTN